MPGTKDKNSQKGKDYTNYQHSDADRPNLPTNEMADDMEVQDISPKYYSAPRREGGEPWLAWDRRWNPDTPVQHRPLFIQEKIHPGALVQSLKREVADPNMTLFNEFNGLTDEQYTQWYQHKARWQNRLIHGNALEVCASLADREGLAGKVQMIFFDPPYGIKFKSNFAMEAGKGDGDESTKQVVADPQSVKAFIDTWEHGVHSYLDAIHKHARMAHALLADSGSFFVQIGDENMMRIGMVLDEVFGAENRIATISFAKSGATSSSTLPLVCDYILWYAKSKENVHSKKLYDPSTSRADILAVMGAWGWVEDPNGDVRSLTKLERINPDHELSKDSRLVQRMRIGAQRAFRYWALRAV